jgi:hypothetical protein
MSAFMCSNDHIALLVNLGRQLNITQIYAPVEIGNFDLRDRDDCQMMFDVLFNANMESVVVRYDEAQRLAAWMQHDNPRVMYNDVALTTPRDIAQAIQWVHCYDYQACEPDNWEDTFAYHYCKRLISELINKLVSLFSEIEWTYDRADMVRQMPAVR